MTAIASMKVHSPNSRIRTISAHSTRKAEALFNHLIALADIGRVVSTFDREWPDGHYRFGGDWLTGQAFELIDLSTTGAADRVDRLQQFEIEDPYAAGIDLAQGLRFSPRNRSRQDEAVAALLRVLKCGVVYTGTPIVLVWMDLAVDSDDPQTWIDFANAMRHRASEGDKADYLRHFIDSTGERLACADIMRPVEHFFLRAPGVELAHSARSLFRLGRFKVLADSETQAEEFLQATVRTSTGRDEIVRQSQAPTTEDRTVTEEAAIQVAYSIDTLCLMIVQKPTAKQARGAVALTNSFNFADLWLSHLICIVQFQLLVSFDRELLDLVNQLRHMGRKRGRIPAVRQILDIKNRYETIMDRCIECYWRFGLIQIHCQPRRHQVYLGLRREMSLDAMLESFHQKLSTLGQYVVEKQKNVLGWFLVYIPFVSFVIGILSINVKGLTANEGLPPRTLGAALVILTVGYMLTIALLRLVVTSRGRAPASQRS